MAMNSVLPMAAIAAATQRRGLFGAPLAADAAQAPSGPMSGDYPYAMPDMPAYTPPSVGRRIIGGIGDAVQQWAGGNATFAPEMEQQRKEALLMQAAQLKRAQDYADWQAKQQYTDAHPEPTQFERDLHAAGIDPSSDQGRALYQQYVTNRADPVQAIPGVDAQGNHVLYQMRSSQMGGQQQPQTLGQTLPQGWTVGGAGPQTPQSFPLFPAR